MAEQLIQIGQLDPSDTLGTTLHHSACYGNKKTLKKVLDKGIHVDYLNADGQTPLFCACLSGRDNVVEYLLSAGANTNEKSNNGLTPVHAACYAGHVKILMKLLNEGGDLRLHDNEGRSVKDWAILQSVPKKRMKMLEFLDKTRLFAMSSSGQDLLLQKASSKTLHRAHHRKNTVTKIIRDRIGRASIHDNLEKMATTHHSLGFGQVYANSSEKTGFLSAIPMVTENNLKHDTEGETYNNGAFSVMESMWWDYTEVTVKRLHRELDPFQGGVVDLLINEIEHIGKLRHPQILTLMGVCQTSNLDGMILIYERIGQGSLYNFLHQKMERLPNTTIQDICVQMCNAIIFLHLRGLVHCAITSHAISVINPHNFKLGNFEYMIEISKCELGKKNAVANNTCENAVYNWMAPEVMLHLPPSFFCDMYSYCVVIWEIFHGDVPWDGQCSDTIRSHYHKGNTLKVYNGKIVDFFQVILEHGLKLDPNQRKLSFLHVRDLLLAAPKDTKNFIRTHFQHLQKNDNGNGLKAHPRPLSVPGTTLPQPTAPPLDHCNTGRMVDHAISEKERRQEKERIRQKNEEKEYEARIASGKDSDRRMELKKEQKRKERKNKDGRQRRGVELLNDEDKYSSRTRQVRGRNNNCQISPAAQYSWRTEQDQRSTNKTPEKPARSVQYTTEGLTWEGFSQELEDEYLYTVKVRRESSPTKSTTRSADSPAFLYHPAYNGGDEVETHLKRPYSPARKPVYDVTSSEETSTSQNDFTSNNMTCPNYTESSNSNKDSGWDPDRKTSSMGKFSYLAIESPSKTRSTGAKPACHVKSDPIAEKFSTAGKLTTSGSLYALYNDHSPGLPRGQPEQQHSIYSTLPRSIEHSSPPAPMKTDPNWFGGRGSVRDLAKVFQKQILQHSFYQNVLDGVINKEHSNEYRKQSTESSDNALQKVASTDENDDDSTTESSVQNMDSNTTIDSSTESDLVSRWVDHELRKIKRHLSQDIEAYNRDQTAISPDLFDRSDNPEQHSESESEELTEITESSTTSPESDENHHQAGDYMRYAPVETFYFDDEMYPTNSSPPNKSPPHIDSTNTSSPPSSTKEETSVSFHSEPASPATTSLPMETVLRTTNAIQQSNNEEVNDTNKKSVVNKRRISRIPTSRTNQMTSKKRNLEGAYANIVTIKSNLDDCGTHQVTHKMKNLKTGGTHTLVNDKISARKVATIFRAAR